MLHSENQAFMTQKNAPGHPYIYSFLLALELMLICALLATSSYRSERKEQEAAEQRKIQEQHKEFLSQKDKAAAEKNFYLSPAAQRFQKTLRQSQKNEPAIFTLFPTRVMNCISSIQKRKRKAI